MALVRKYPADRLTVERAATWFKRRRVRAPVSILTRLPREKVQNRLRIAL